MPGLDRFRRLMAREDGYTLTEMLVVIGIIALIAAVLTPNLMQQMGRARLKAAQLQLDTVAADVELFRTDVGRYPTQAEGLSILITAPAGLEGWSGPYLKDAKMLNDPWGHPILYTLEGDGHSFHLESLGATGKPGGAGNARSLRSPAASS